MQKNVSTRQVILNSYHSSNPKRVMADNPEVSEIIQKAFRRIYKHILPQNKESAILDTGCGEGYFLKFLKSQEYNNLDGFDLSPENVELCHKQGFNFVQLHDALDISSFARHKRWDMIFCLDVLEHLPKESLAGFLIDIRQRLSETGSIIFQVPNMAYLFASYNRYSDITHEVGFTETSITSLLNACGFQNVNIRPAWNATTPAGHCRELCLRVAHKLLYMLEGRGSPRIATRNLLAQAYPHSK